MELRVAFRTLGCKLNQLETESLADAFRLAGAVILPFEAAADLYVINTCTVTGKAEQKARRLSRQAAARRPGAVVLATGCYAQLEPEALARLDERLVVVPGAEKAAILSLAAWLGERWQGHGDLLDAVLEWRRAELAPGTVAGTAVAGTAVAGVALDPFAFVPAEFAFHSRPALKIQDGCDRRCSYCRVCLARGPSRSLPAARVLERLRILEDEGRAEAILTGVNLSQYADGDMGFPGLLRFLLAGSSRIALRLSSFEPERVDAEFLELFAENRIRPHVHLPVQSGSDAMLARMARPYRRDRILRVAEALRTVRQDPFLAADFIAGFPGETDADHAQSLELAREAGFAWIHAFPFSPRPGTKAWDFRPRVPERVAGERVAELSALARAGRAAYVWRWLGKEVDAVLEGEGEEGQQATTENYLKALVQGPPAATRHPAAAGPPASPGLPAGRGIRLRLLSMAGLGMGEERSRDSGESGVPGEGTGAAALGTADFLAQSIISG